MGVFNQLVITAMPVVPKGFVGKIASRYIAGETLADAILEVKHLNAEGAMATVDLLGEHCTTEEDARNAFQVYINILDNIKSSGIDSNVSVKPTHMGLKISYNLSKELISRIVAHAKSIDNFVRIDMEDYTCTDDTLNMYYQIRENFDNVGVVIQAYLRRTINDIDSLIKRKANLRLCKGIYNEPRYIAFKNRNIIINNYALVLEELLSSGCYVGIATHCEETVWHALRIIRKLRLKRDQYEFQMLLGVDPELRKILTSQGHRLRVYVPFGKEWYPYSTRRLKENPDLAGAVAKDFLKISNPGS